MEKLELEVFVIGSGVIGLSTAIRALEAGYNVTIFAEIFPGDPKTIEYTSFWAGANHISVATYSDLMHQLERETMQTFLDLIKEDPLVPVMTRPQINYTETMTPEIQNQFNHICQFYPDSRSLDAGELPKNVVAGVTFTTICVDVPRYLPYLMERFLRAGGKACRAKVSSLSSLISESYHHPTIPRSSNPKSAAVINCTGLGALSLGDVLDTDVFPTRGETLIIRAPWVHHGMTYYNENGDISYIIPRQSGDVILGGTFQVDDWHPTSRPETVRAIKERGIRAYPELLPAGKRANPDINDLDVVAECVGLRTTRKGGIRLETTSLDVDGQTFPVIHNYGHGGAGYQTSWGSAKHAIDLLQATLKR
ncbi:D-aspartate oxidase [Mycena belliarum]|uniref:D-aspartate oxidase n=1 Tax=Mycena belliarum TaxID=1033014 RepID=A0AAD6U3K2_9AGAR|nr:D-aspartate oxidase [Mycena belliae]